MYGSSNEWGWLRMGKRVKWSSRTHVLIPESSETRVLVSMKTSTQLKWFIDLYLIQQQFSTGASPPFKGLIRLDLGCAASFSQTPT